METVRADLVIELNVECPECNSDIDLVRETGLNDEGQLLKETITDEAWERDPDDRLDCAVKCPCCDTIFHVKGVNW